MEETPVVPRSAVAIYLPSDEFLAVSAELAEAGYEAIGISSVDEFEALLEARPDVGLAILDGESDFDATIEMYSLLHDGERNVASLMVVSSTALDRLSLAGRARINGEFVTRPYSAASLRWRVEAMLIRAETMMIRAEALDDDARGAILDGLSNIIYVYIIAEYRGSVNISAFDRRTGKTEIF